MKVLSFPHYFPDKRDLWAYLLLYDEVATMVPWADRSGLRANTYLYELEDVDRSIFRFVEPRPPLDLHSEINIRDYATRDSFYRRNDAAHARNLRARAQNFFRRDRGYEPPPETIDYFKSLGWRNVAMQKFPSNFLDELIESGLAISGHSHDYETLPVLVPGSLANAIMSKVAAKVCHDEDLAAVGETSKDIVNLCATSKPQDSFHRASLVPFAIEAALPKDLDQIGIDRLMDLREEYSGVREQLNYWARDVSNFHDLDRPNASNRLAEKLEEAKNQIEREIRTANRRVGIFEPIFSAVSIVVTLGLAGVNGVIPGPLAGILTSAFGMGTGYALNRLVRPGTQDGAARNLVVMGNRIQREINRQNYARIPSGM